MSTCAYTLNSRAEIAPKVPISRSVNLIDHQTPPQAFVTTQSTVEERHTGKRHKHPEGRHSKPPRSTSPSEADPFLQPPHGTRQVPGQPRPPHPPALPLEPPCHRHQQPHVPRDPVQVPPHRDEEHPRPIVLSTRLKPRPQPLPVPISEQVAPQTNHQRRRNNPPK